MASKYTQITAIFCILFALKSQASQDWVTYELEGKFTERHGSYSVVNSLSAKADFRKGSEDRVKRDVDYKSSLDFTGSLTVKTPRETVVVGVNTTFQFLTVFPEQNSDSNRTKREATPKLKYVLYGQIGMGDLLPRSEVLRIKLDLDIRQASHQRKPDDAFKESTGQIGFKGAMSASGRNAEDALNFALNVGVKQESFSNSDYDYDGQGPKDARYKRESDNVPKLKVIGQFTVDESRYTTIYDVNAEATFDVTEVTDGLSPRDKFLQAEKRDRILFETTGNLTGKIDEMTAFTKALATAVDMEGEVVREKRGSRDDQVLELDYDGVFKTTYRSGAYEAGVSFKSKYWLISKAPIPSK